MCVNDCKRNGYFEMTNNGVCDDNEVYGCTYSSATNFNELATSGDGSCVFELDCDENGAYNLGFAAGMESVDCPETSSSPSDLDGDDLVGSADLLIFLSAFGTYCETADVPGCMDATSCNYNAEATADDGSCEY